MNYSIQKVVIDNNENFENVEQDNYNEKIEGIYSEVLSIKDMDVCLDF